MKVIYVAGRYRSKCEWQLEEAIRHAEDTALKLWEYGWAVICPHKNTAHFGGALDILDETWLRGDLEILHRCDAIYMLRGWEQSEGAQEEHKLALREGKEIIYEVKEGL